MKKIFFVLLLIPVFTYSQSISEKSLLKFGNLTSTGDGNSIKIDDKSGTYLYQDYDSVSQKDILFSNKGNSGSYSYIDYYNALFDADGNYYVIADNNLTDTTYSYYILKNGKEIATYNEVNMGWLMNHNKIYFICKDKDKSYLVVYDPATGNFSKGNEYDDVQPCSYPVNSMGDEPQATVGFTRDGEPFYVAKQNNEAFLVIGTKEQKHYADIDAYTVTLDSISGKFIYAAKSSGQFYNAGNSFTVMGDKEYKKFDYIYSPFYIDPASGDPVYIAADSLPDSTPQRVMIGDREASKTYSGGLYNLGFTQSGKMYFVASEMKSNNTYYSYVVFDGKEGKKYQSIGIMKVLPGDKLIYTANKSDKEAVIVNDNKEIETDYSSVLDVSMVGSKLAYVQGNYGDYSKKIKDEFYVQIGEDEFGPYNTVSTINLGGMDYILSDKSGNYAYIGQRLTNFKDYIYKSSLYSNSDESKEYDMIENIALVNGKPLYTASYSTDKTDYIYKYRIYYGNKTIGAEYDAINNYNYDGAGKLATFTGIRNKEVFHVEIKF